MAYIINAGADAGPCVFIASAIVLLLRRYMSSLAVGRSSRAVQNAISSRNAAVVVASADKRLWRRRRSFVHGGKVLLSSDSLELQSHIALSNVFIDCSQVYVEASLKPHAILEQLHLSPSAGKTDRIADSYAQQESPSQVKSVTLLHRSLAIKYSITPRRLARAWIRIAWYKNLLYRKSEHSQPVQATRPRRT